MITAAGIILYHPDHNMVMLVHPTNHPDNYWSIPKGGKDQGETLWECAIREFKEECGVVIPPALDHEQFHVGEYKSGHKKLFIYLVDARGVVGGLSDVNNFKCSSYVEPNKWNNYNSFPEVDNYKWFTPEQAFYKVHPVQRDAFTKLMNWDKL